MPIDAVRQHGCVIESAEEFVALRSSDDPADYGRAASDPASNEVWFEVMRRAPRHALLGGTEEDSAY